MLAGLYQQLRMGIGQAVVGESADCSTPWPALALIRGRYGCLRLFLLGL